MTEIFLKFLLFYLANKEIILNFLILYFLARKMKVWELQNNFCLSLPYVGIFIHSILELYRMAKYSGYIGGLSF